MTKKNRKLLSGAFAALCVAGVALLFGCGEREDRYLVYSGGQTGVYYPTAQALAGLVNAGEHGFRLEVRTSGGSTENARALARGRAQFALMQNDIAAYAREGTQQFTQAIPEILGVAALYPEHVQIASLAEAGINSVEDLRGRRVAIGAIGSGTEANAQQILEAYGLSTADLSLVERLDASDSADYLQDGRVDAAFFTFGVGTASIQELASRRAVAFVAVSGEARATLMETYPFYREAVIPEGAYPGVEADVETVSVMATLVAHEETPAEVVEAVLDAMFTGLERFQRTHARLQAVDRESARADLTLPMHPGAEAFYGR